MRILPVLIALIAPLAVSFSVPAAAGDFPGTGDPHGWSDALPYYNLGNKYLNQQRYSEAAQKYQEAIDRYAYDADFFINLGVSLRKLDDYVGAEQAFTSATKLNDKDWAAWMNLGNAYLKQDRLKDTLAAFERSLKCNPPAEDKKVLTQNLVDIHKILRATGQEPLPETIKAKAVATKKGKKVTGNPTKAAPLAASPKPTNASSATQPATKATGRDWGYE